MLMLTYLKANVDVIYLYYTCLFKNDYDTIKPFRMLGSISVKNDLSIYLFK